MALFLFSYLWISISYNCFFIVYLYHICTAPYSWRISAPYYTLNIYKALIIWDIVN